jgi:hypothetical protein
LQETVAEPEPVTLAGVIAPQVRPEGTLSEKLTTPLKPFKAVIVIVEFTNDPAFAATGGDAKIVKSWNRKATMIECVREPLVPVTVRL